MNLNSQIVDKYATQVLQQGALLASASPVRFEAARQQYDDAYRRLFESCIYRFIDGERVPGALGQRLVREMDRLDVNVFDILERAIGHWDRQRPFLPFLRRIMTNAVRDKYRRQYISLEDAAPADDGGTDQSVPSTTSPAVGAADAGSSRRYRFVEVAANASSGDADPESLTDSQRAYNYVLDVFAGSGATYPDVAFLFLHGMSGQSYESLADMANEELLNLGEAAAQRLRPFYNSASLRKRAERLRETMSADFGADIRLREAIRVLDESHDLPSRGLLPVFVVRRIVAKAVDRLRDIRVQAEIVAESVSGHLGERKMLREFESALSGVACRELFTQTVRADDRATRLYTRYLQGDYSIGAPLPDNCLDSIECRIFKIVAAGLLPPDRPWDQMILRKSTEIDALPLWKLLDTMECLHSVPQHEIEKALRSVDPAARGADLRQRPCFVLDDKYFQALLRIPRLDPDAEDDIIVIRQLAQCDRELRQIRRGLGFAAGEGAERWWQGRLRKAEERWDQWFEQVRPAADFLALADPERDGLCREVRERTADLRSLMDVPAPAKVCVPIPA